jgi:hypothetical protein
LVGAEGPREHPDEESIRTRPDTRGASGFDRRRSRHREAPSDLEEALERKLAAVRQDLDREYEAALTPAARSFQPQFSSRNVL